VSRNVLLLVVALGALRDPCGTDTTAAGVNGPCTRTKDCQDGLSCVEGVCSPPDAGVADSGSDATDSGTPDAPDGSAAD
jgi:hypothetical protein